MLNFHKLFYNRRDISKKLFAISYFFFAKYLPSHRWGRIGIWSDSLRRFLCRRLFKKTGRIFGVCRGVDFPPLGCNVTLGEHANLGPYATIQGNGDLIMGEHIMMGENVHIYTQDHKISGMGFDGFTVATVKIGNHVWIGGNVVILRGVTIGDNSVIGAGSIVTKDVLPGAIVAGSPARLIRFRNSEKA